MSKTILADVDGFTPIIDGMAIEHGLVYASVFGRIWRFCQMEDGVCKASLETIAHGLGLNKATIMRYADRLVEDGYLKDLTPDLRNMPHIYADTGKASIRIGVVAQDNADIRGVAGCNAGVAQGNAGVAESKLNKVFKRVSKKDRRETAPRQRNELFDVLAEVTNSDPKAAGGYIGKTATDLAQYSPADIRKWYGANGWWYTTHCRDMNPPPTPSLSGICKTIKQAADSVKPKVIEVR